jgi:hypothetical protein
MFMVLMVLDSLIFSTDLLAKISDHHLSEVKAYNHCYGPSMPRSLCREDSRTFQLFAIAVTESGRAFDHVVLGVEDAHRAEIPYLAGGGRRGNRGYGGKGWHKGSRRKSGYRGFKKKGLYKDSKENPNAVKGDSSDPTGRRKVEKKSWNSDAPSGPEKKGGKKSPGISKEEYNQEKVTPQTLQERDLNGKKTKITDREASQNQMEKTKERHRKSEKR